MEPSKDFFTHNPRARAEYTQQVVSFNVQQLLAAQGKRKVDLAKYLGITGAGMSQKFSRSNWKLDEALMAADYLGTSVEALTNDQLMRMLLGDSKVESMISDLVSVYQGEHDVHPDKQQLAGSAQPRSLKKNDQDDDAPKTPGVSGPRFLVMPDGETTAMIQRLRGYFLLLPGSCRTRQWANFTATHTVIPVTFLLFGNSWWVLLWVYERPEFSVDDCCASLAVACLLSPAVVSLASRGLLG